MRRRLALALVVVLVALAVWFALDVRFDSFEDGSGRIVWCVLGALCDD